MALVQNVNEAVSWIRDKLQMTKDESYRDSDLESKKKKHQEFEAEVNANEQRIQTIAQVKVTFLYNSARELLAKITFLLSQILTLHYIESL